MADKLTKDEIAKGIIEKTGLSRNEIYEVLNAFFDELKSGLAKGETVELRGFGTFEVVTRKGRQNARNPKTGEIVSVEDHGTVKFRAGTDLKKKVWDR